MSRLVEGGKRKYTKNLHVNYLDLGPTQYDKRVKRAEDLAE